jgi:hypothetical protein
VRPLTLDAWAVWAAAQRAAASTACCASSGLRRWVSGGAAGGSGLKPRPRERPIDVGPMRCGSTI